MAGSRSRSRSTSQTRGKRGKGKSAKTSKKNSKNTKRGPKPDSAKSSDSTLSISKSHGIGNTHQNNTTEFDELVKVEVLPEPYTSPRDPNHYRFIRLDNGFRAALISTLGYAWEEAEKNVKQREKEKYICENKSDTSVFNRNRGKRGSKDDEDADGITRRIRKTESKTHTKCFDRNVEHFDRDMIEMVTRTKRESTKSLLDEVQALVGVVGEPIDVDEQYTDPRSDSVVTRRSKAVDDEDEDDDDDEDVFKPVEEVSTPASEQERNASTVKSPAIIRTKWGPERETEDAELLKEERVIMQQKTPELDMALTFAAGSMNDDSSVRGLSHLARETVIRALKEKEVHPYQQQFNPAEYTTIRMTTKLAHMHNNLKHIADHVEHLRVEKKDVLKDIDTIDRAQENIQCTLCWDSPMIDERRLAILASLAKEEHPVRVISSGHPPDLWTSEELKNEQLEKHVFEFIKTYYIGSATTLAIKAAETLDNLQDAVANSFTLLAPGNKTDLSHDEAPFNTSEFKMFYRVLCSNPHCSDMGDAFLVIAWGLPPACWQNYLTKPLDHLGALISHKGAGGLGHYLRERNLVWDLNAGCDTGSKGMHRNKFCSLFEIQATLNEEGFKKTDEVVAIIFSYLKFIRESGPAKDFFVEQQKMRAAQFHALGQEIDLEDPFPVSVSKLSVWLQMYNTRDILTAPIMMRKFDEPVIQECIDLLVPETANYMLCVCAESIEAEDESDEVLTEDVFNTKYVKSAISPERYKAWNDVLVYPEFKFPEPNPFIHVDSCRVDLEPFPETFKLFDPNPNEDTKIKDFYRIWYQQDLREDHFAIYYIHVISPVAYSSPENAVMLQVWYLLLQDLLHPHLGPAHEAGINYNLKPTHHGLLVAVFSWNSRISTIVEIIMREIAEFGANVQKDSFKKKKKGLLKHIAGLVKDEFLSNHTVASDLYKTLTHVHSWKLIDLYNELLKVNMKHFLEFTEDFKRRFSVAALIRGNVNFATAKVLSSGFETILIPNFAIKKFHVRQNILPKHYRVLRFKTMSDFTIDNYVYNCYQIGRTCVKTRVCADFFHMCLADFLKKIVTESALKHVKKPETKKKSTKKNDPEQKESYQILSKLIEEQGIVTLILESNGSNFHNSLEKLDRRADDLLEDFYTSTFNKMCDKEFKHLKMQLGDDKYYDPEAEWDGNETFFYDLSGLYGNIEDLTFRFSEKYCKLEALQKLTLDDIQDFYKKHLSHNTCEYRKLSIQIYGNEVDKILDRPHATPETQEAWRLRRKDFRECTFNDYHTLIHAHKMGKTETFHILFEPEFKGECSNDHFVADFTRFKREMFQFPIKFSQY